VKPVITALEFMVFICFDAVFAALLMETGNDVNGNDE